MTAVFAAVFLISSAVSLARGYEFPKQDFEGAVKFVDAEKKSGEIVATAGAATYPLQQYYGMTWESAETTEKMEDICSRNQPVWLVYTLPRYMSRRVTRDNSR